MSGWESDSRAVDLSVGQCDTVWTVGQCGDIRQLELRETQVSPPLDTDLSLTEDTDWTIIQSYNEADIMCVIITVIVSCIKYEYS